MADRVNVLLFMDRPETAGPYKTFLENQGMRVALYTDAATSLRCVEEGVSGFDVALIHKDLGVHNASEWHIRDASGKVTRRIHEEGRWIRVGVVSGECPNGVQHVLEMQADFYCSYLDLSGWALEQIKKGWVNEDEIKQRGRSVEMPPLITGLERKW